MKITIAIIEDTTADAKMLSDYLSDWAALNSHTINIQLFNSSEKILKNDDLQFDMLFVDVMLPGLHGTDLIRRLHKSIPDALYVLMSSESRYMKTGYALDVHDFMCKPYELDDLSQIMSRAMLKLQVRNNELFTIYTDKTARRIPYHDILFIEVTRNYATAHSDNGKLVFRSTVAQLHEQLPDYFVQSSRNTMVNIMRVTEISPTGITFGKYDVKADITKSNIKNIQEMFYKFY